MDKEKIGKLLRILLVEDNEHDARAFRRAFEKAEIPCEITHCLKAELNRDSAQCPDTFLSLREVLYKICSVG